MILPHGGESSIFLCCSEFFPPCFLYPGDLSVSFTQCYFIIILFIIIFIFLALSHVLLCGCTRSFYRDLSPRYSVLLASPHGVNIAQLRYPMRLGAGLVCSTWPSRKWTWLGKCPVRM